MKLFDVQISERGENALQVALSGEIDLSTISELQTRVDEALAGGHPDMVLLDLRKVEFLDSSGLRLMLRLHERLNGDGSRLVLVKGGRRVSRVFELTGADEELEIVDDPSKVDGS